MNETENNNREFCKKIEVFTPFFAIILALLLSCVLKFVGMSFDVFLLILFCGVVGLLFSGGGCSRDNK